jgi:hypothetical protein
MNHIDTMPVYQTYIHRRNDTGQVFYVGAGNAKRPYVTYTRSEAWNAIAAGGYSIEIAARWNTPKEAGEHESFLIECFKDMGHPLVNKQKGGGGGIGFRPSPETLLKMSAAQSGKIISAEARKKIGAFHSGKKNSKQTIEKISASKRGVALSDEHRKNIGLAQIGKKVSDETKARITEKVKVANAIRYRCAECQYESAPGTLGCHHKKTGHKGRVFPNVIERNTNV